MQTDSVDGSPQRIAPRWHLAILLWVHLWVAATGGRSIQWILSAQNLEQFHFRVTFLYLLIFAWEWLQVWYVWYGLRKTETSLWSLIGGSWSSWGKIAKDLGIGLAYWALWIAALMAYSKLSGPADRSHNVSQAMAPRTEIQIALWIMISASAGFCEEILYRGYLQRQFLAMSNNMTVAVVGQALLFGLAHVYEGVVPAVIISISGFFFGWLAAWRRSLRPGMIAHAWYDAFIGVMMYVALLYYPSH